MSKSLSIILVSEHDWVLTMNKKILDDRRARSYPIIMVVFTLWLLILGSETSMGFGFNTAFWGKTYPEVNFSPVSQSLPEPATGTTAVTITVSLTFPSGEDILVPYTVSGTADSNDHTLASGNVIITAGNTSQSVNFNILSDATAYEYSESIAISMGTPSNALLGTSSVAGVTITEAIVAANVVQIYDADQSNIIPPANADRLNIKAWGGGGGAGQPDDSTSGGGSGGPGGYVIYNDYVITSTDDIDLTIGGGGLGCDATTAGTGAYAGGNGSSLKNTTASAGAGTGGAAGGGGFNGCCNGGAGGKGGGGGGCGCVNPTADLGGGGGGASVVTINSLEVVVAGGGGGGAGSGGGNGGAGGSGCNGAPIAPSGHIGTNPGGGGGGGACVGGTGSTGSGINPANTAEAGNRGQAGQGTTTTTACAASHDGTGGRVILTFSTIDLTAPVNATNLSWQDGASSSNITITASWTKSTSSDLASQELWVYRDANCYLQDGAKVVMGTTAISQSYAPSASGNLYFRIRSFDDHGYLSDSICSPVIAYTRLPRITYAGNGATSGTVPSSQAFASGTIVTVASNSGSLARTGYTFAGWNTAADGNGTSYTAGTGTFTMSTADVTLYARWTINSYSVSYSGNSNTGGTAPASANYDYNTTVIVAGNSGSLTRTNYAFTGWNTAVDGSGTDYAVGSNLIMGTANITLYAKWVPSCGDSVANNCYTGANSATCKSLGSIVTPSGKSLTYNTTTGVWEESGAGTRVLASDGLDNWAMQLQLDGRSYHSSNSLNKTNVAGRTCPTSVFIPDNFVATDKCLYYDAGNPTQSLGAAGTSQTVSGQIGIGAWDNATSGNGTLASWYEGNIQTCASKGMRLPTLYETNVSDPGGSNKPSDASPNFSPGSGVPKGSLPYAIWTASGHLSGTGRYWLGNDASGSYNQSGNFNVRCVVP